jgi:hypothetical protein
MIYPFFLSFFLANDGHGGRKNLRIVSPPAAAADPALTRRRRIRVLVPRLRVLHAWCEEGRGVGWACG